MKQVLIVVVLFTIFSFAQANCVVGEWSEWSPCSVTCAGPVAGTRSRVRQILIPSSDGSRCPPLENDGGLLRQEEQCRPSNDCPEQRCEGLCTGCSLSHQVGSENWCTCCAAQDISRDFWMENPCSTIGGCQSTIYTMSGCVADGFCGADGNTAGKLCEEFGKCDKLSPTPAPTPAPSPPMAQPTPCEVSEWSEWSPCSLSCASATQRTGTQSRTRTVLNRPADGSLCPLAADYGGLVEETRSCSPVLDCPEVQCDSACQGCGIGALPGTAKWCRCCRANDVQGTFDMTQPCLGSGCPNSIFQFDGCVRDGYCSQHCLDSGHCDSGANPLQCVLSEWSSWGPCSVSCTGDAAGGVQTRTRTIVQLPNDGSACPGPEHGPLQETRRCFPPDCPELRCDGACAGCSNANLLRGAEDWCACCAAQDRNREFWTENPCKDGCSATAYEFDTCLQAGFCTAESSSGSLLCARYGYCSNVIRTPPPPSSPTPSTDTGSCGLLSGSCGKCTAAAPHCQWCAFGQPISGHPGVCVSTEASESCIGVAESKLIGDSQQCPGADAPTSSPTPAPTVPAPPAVPQCAVNSIGECPDKQLLGQVCVWQSGVCQKLLTTYVDLPFNVPTALLSINWTPIQLALSQSMRLDPQRIYLLVVPGSTKGVIRVFDAANDPAAPYFDLLRRSVQAGSAPDYLTIDEMAVKPPPSGSSEPGVLNLGLSALVVGAILVFSALLIALGIWCYSSGSTVERAIDHGSTPAVIPVQRKRASAIAPQSLGPTNSATAIVSSRRRVPSSRTFAGGAAEGGTELRRPRRSRNRAAARNLTITI